jgi:hypothetical protein
LAGIEVDADIEAVGILWNCGHGDVSERLPATRAHVPTMSREAARLEIAADTPAVHAAELIPVVETPTRIRLAAAHDPPSPSGYGGQRGPDGHRNHAGAAGGAESRAPEARGSACPEGSTRGASPRGMSHR